MTRHTAVSLLVMAFLVAPARADTRARHRFGHRTFEVILPAGYTLQAEASPKPWLKTFAFATEGRQDGTRGLIQVTLLDLEQAQPGRIVELAEFATAMVGGVRIRRSQWKTVETDTELDGVAARRIEWSGSSEPSPERPAAQSPAMMRGVLVIGIKHQLGFVLHAQDFEAFAATTGPLAERALRSFVLETGAAQP